MTSELDALSFTPTAGAPGSQTTTTFTLSRRSSAFATPTVNAATTVIDVDGAVAPTITGAAAGQTTNNEAVAHPFSGVTIGDANVGATETLTITLSGGGGTLTGTGLSGGSGTYTLSRLGGDGDERARRAFVHADGGRAGQPDDDDVHAERRLERLSRRRR